MSNETMVRSVETADRETEIDEIMKVAMTVARNKPNTPPDGGSGYEISYGRTAVGEAIELVTNPYAGTEPPTSVTIRQPINEFMLRKPA